MDILSAGLIGFKLGKFGADLWWGKDKEKIDQAIEFIDYYEKSNFTDTKYLSKAESLLESIPSNEKDYILTGKYYGLGYCYALEGMFEASLKCLDYVRDVRIETLTACPDTIREVQKLARVLRKEVIKELNENRKNSSDQNEQDNISESEFNSFWNKEIGISSPIQMTEISTFSYHL